MKYELCEGVTIENIDGQNILTTERGDAAVLNETAQAILSHVLGETDCTSAVQKLADVYNVDSNTVREDAEQLLSELMEKQLICLR